MIADLESATAGIDAPLTGAAVPVYRAELADTFDSLGAVRDAAAAAPGPHNSSPAGLTSGGLRKTGAPSRRALTSPPVDFLQQ